MDLVVCVVRAYTSLYFWLVLFIFPQSPYEMFVYLCLCMQGERGEPGFVVAADGAMLSAGPVGPKGDKVRSPTLLHFLVVFFCMHITRELNVLKDL